MCEEKGRVHVKMCMHHRNEPKVAFFLQVRFDKRETAACRFSNSLYKNALPDTELDTNIIRAQLGENRSGRTIQVARPIRTRFMHRYTAWSKDLGSFFLLLWMTSSRNEVRIAVFSKRFVVASINENVFVKAA